jgi:hypothetical protein
MEPIDLVQFTRIGCAITENNFLSSNGHAFSRIFKKSFRSLYEVHFAETAVLIWKEEVLYEPHIIRLRMRGSGFSHYVPDFYFPAYGVWVETKGVWSIGGKRKFVHAMKMIGRDRLLLLPSSQGNVWCADRGKW